MSAGERFDAVEAVRAAADLHEVVSGYVALKKSGGNRWRGLCPFHQEKTPSFYVDADKQLYYCFGCAAGGDVFKFLMLYEKLDFPEALKALAARYGVTLPAARSPELSERQRIVDLNREVVAYFREQLMRPAGERARKYLAGRGLNRDVAERFLIGYAPDGWTGLKDHLGQAGGAARDKREALAVAAGLLARKEETGRTYDRFRDRVIFPIVNLADEVIGFGGRVIGTGEPKYLNSPDSSAFNKGDNLYALPYAREAIRKLGYAVLVEGYMDAIALQVAGATEAVATLGTGFTTGHVRLLKRFTEQVVVNFDPDAAGRQATRRSLEILLENGFEVRVVSLPAGKDPDLFVREQGIEKYRERVRGALPYLEYLAREVAGRVDLGSARGKVQALNEVLPYLAHLDNPVRRAAHVEMLASVFSIEDRLVLQELKEAVRERRKDVGGRAVSALATRRPESEAEAGLVRALMDDVEVRRALLGEVDEADLGSPRVREIVRAVKELDGAGEEVTWPRVGAVIGDEARDALTFIAALPHPPVSEEAGRGCLSTLRATRITRQMTEVQRSLMSCSAEEQDDLLRRKLALKKQIEALRGAPA
ncbi:MAG TPA: DNA primase [Candidatus Polarisedimenticolia bacterium]|nr:DNA primase [Candidatus Polarisedimenticolia bacterium]